ncbi:MAG TPA: hypothetical protein VNX68_15280 [Nitrosopumilaceae archaeon]|jgi:hypothetical protein|nr:hypothetical protein [Nitrosopumilaceae archaeon]
MCECTTNTCTCKAKIASEALIAEFPVLIKASIVKGQRTIDLEASATVKDAEGDVILQKALLEDKDHFISEGHLDIDHYSELAKNPDFDFLGLGKSEQWIIGKPLGVKDLGNYRTGVKAFIFSNPNGKSNPQEFKYDWIWEQLIKGGEVWKASVYGYPGPDTQEGGCVEGTDGWVCATRYLVKSFKWCSLALTKNPINQGLKDPVRVISAKSFAANIGNCLPIPKGTPIFNRNVIRKSYNMHMASNCPETSHGKDINVNTMRNHFMKCDHLPYYLADMYALATKELITR